MPFDDRKYVSREEYEKFQESLTELLGPFVEAFDKGVDASMNIQASIENLTQIIQSLDQQQEHDSDRLKNIEELLRELHSKLLKP